jgi:predicted phage tail protein
VGVTALTQIIGTIMSTIKDKNLIKVTGSGGKGGGREPFEADDNMFARQHAAFIDVIGEGPIKGLVYGDASILVDETRMRDVNQRTGQRSGSPNIKNFRIVEEKGTATQIPNADFFHSFPSASLMRDIGSAELLLNEPQYHTIPSGSFEKQNTDYIKVTMSTSGMLSITKKGDNSGDRRGTNVHFNIDFRWTDSVGTQHTKRKFTTGFTGKVSGKYAHTFGFNIEADKAEAGMVDWALKIERVGGAVTSDYNEVSNSIYIDSIEASIADKLQYPHTAYIAGAIDAEQFSSIPGRGYEVDGKLISIPTNHYPLDYNGRKVTVASISGFTVGDSVKQDGMSVSSLTAEFANKDSKVDDNDELTGGDADDGYVATATCAAHGITVGNVFTATIAGVTGSEADFWNGTFNCLVTTETQFTYTLNALATDANNADLKTLAGSPTFTAAGTKTAELFSGGMIDKIGTNTLYLRNVSPTSTIVTGSNITNAASEGGDSTNVTAVEQVFIPANYRRNSSTEKVDVTEYDWDGTFYSSWCNNPAWVYNDLITNKIYGLGNYLSQTQVNKWEIYQIGRYCDELVPAGVAAADLLSLYTTNDQNYTADAISTNEYEPRFSCNLVLAGQAQAFKVLNDVTSIFRGMTYWLNGEAFVVQDSEKDPVYQFTTGNVINGEFKYEGTAFKTRTNQIIVNWNNPQDFYRPRAEIVELEETLQKDGQFLKTDSISAFGCTSRGQARRLGKWKLLSNQLHTNTVSFATGLNAAFLRPGDIVQVFDNAKEGKSWGGRIKTGSSTSSIKLDRQWEVETGYSYNDYQITTTNVGYKAILAQDSAIIEVEGSNVTYLRGQEITAWRDSDGIIDSSRGWEDGQGDITLDSEEKAANVFDKDGNMVFIQWTPFTNTETKWIDNSDNANPSSLTINTDGLNSVIFAEAPAAESMWIISRSALATGKTKTEAKLFRILQLAETDEHTLEIQALEYNATKFDAVDKNEAISEERQIFLPSSFTVTPPPTNLQHESSIALIADNQSMVNRITFSWSPPKILNPNTGELGPYLYVREYEVFYSKDKTKWFHAGSTSNTSLDVDGQTTGIFHLRVFTRSVQDKRSVAADARFDIGFARTGQLNAIGYDKKITKVGTISGDYTLDGGKVTFEPDTVQHHDGINTHTITSQAQLDFTGLVHTSTTGGNTGYIYMDHSASAFKAIAHDETSDQFYTVGSSVFATATGTITCSDSSVGDKQRQILGLDSSVFSTELAVDNKLKFTKSSVDYYHRITTIDSNTEILVEPAVKVTVVDGDNQAFSKPTFLADYKTDTIIGMVEKLTASTYSMTKFGNSSGESGYTVQGTNESHTFAGNSSNEISASDYSAYSNTYTVEKSGRTYAFASSGTTTATFGLTVTSVTGFSATTDVNINSSTGVITIDDNSLDSVTSGTATITVKDLQRDYTIGIRVISFAKAASGAAGGSGTIAVKLTPSAHVITYDTEGAEVGTQSLTFTTAIQGYDGTAFYEFLVDGAAPSGGAVNSETTTFTLPDANEPAHSTTKTIKVNLRDGATDGAIKATDTVGLYGIKSGSDAYTVIVTNEAHTLPTTIADSVTYTGAGTDILVFKGSTALTHKDSGTAGLGEFKVSVNSDTNITVNPSPSTVTRTTTNDTRRYGVPSGMTATNAEIEYSISVEGIQTIIKSQTFAKSQQGATGDDAKVVVVTPSTPVMWHTVEVEPEIGGTFEYWFPESITISAATTNTTTNGVWSALDKNGSTNRTSNLTSVVQTHTSPSCVITKANMLDGIKVTYTLAGADGGTSDSTTLNFLETKDGGVAFVLSNETHTYQAAADGSVSSVTGSGTNISVYQGGRKLDYDTVGTADAHWKVHSIENVANLTEGTLSSSAAAASGGGRHAIVSNHTPTTGTNNYSIDYTLKGVTSGGDAFTEVVTQTLTKAIAGVTGSTGASVNIVFIRAATIPSTPGNSSALPTGWVDSPPSGTDLLWASRGEKAVGSNVFVWTTAFQVEGAAHAEVYIYRKNNATAPSGGSYNFTNNTLALPTNWANAPQALTANGDDVYVSVGLATGASTATAASISWSAVVLYATRTDGDDGDDGISVKTETLFQKGSSAPSYTATAGTYADPDNGNGSWSYTMATLADGEKMWAITRSFNSDNSSTANWTAPVNILTRTNGTNATALTITSTQADTPSAGRTTVNFSDGSSFVIDDGTNGNDGDGVDVIYQNIAKATTTLATPGASSGAPTDWSFTMTAPTSAQRTWISLGVRTNNTGNYTWSPPTPVTAVDGADSTVPGPTGKSTTTIYYLQTGFAIPTAPSNGTDETPGSWILTIPTAAANKSIWWSIGTREAGGTSWTFTAPSFYLGDFAYTIPGIFGEEYDISLNLSGLGMLGLTDSSYANSSNPVVTSGVGAIGSRPAASGLVVGSTYYDTTNNILYIATAAGTWSAGSVNNLAELDGTANTKLGNVAANATNNNVSTGTTSQMNAVTGTEGDMWFDTTLGELRIWE